MSRLRSSLSMIAVFAIMAFFAAPIAGATAASSSFPDLSPDSASLKAIEYLNRENILRGGDDGNYHPADNLNRAEWATVLARLAGANPSLNNYNNCFPDVKDEWYAAGVCLARQQGWMTGYEAGALAGKFGPDLPVSNAEVLVTLQRLQNWDVPAGENWYEPAFLFAKAKNIYSDIDSVIPVPRELLADLLFRDLATVELGKNVYSNVLDDLVFTYNIYDLVDVSLKDYTDYYYFDAVEVPNFESSSALVCDQPENTCTPSPQNYEVGDEFDVSGYHVVISNMDDDKVFLTIDGNSYEIGVMESLMYPQDDPVFTLTMVDFDNSNGTLQVFVHEPEVTVDDTSKDIFTVNYVDTESDFHADVILFEDMELSGPYPPSEAAGSDPDSCFVLAFYRLGIEIQYDDTIMSTLDTGIPYAESSALFNVSCDFVLPTTGSLENGASLYDESALTADNFAGLEINSFSAAEGYPQIKIPDVVLNTSSTAFDYEVRTTGAAVQSTQILLYDTSYGGWVYGWNSDLATTTSSGTVVTDEIKSYSFAADKVKVNGNELNSLSNIDQGKGFFVQANLIDGSSYLLGDNTVALGSNKADDNSGDGYIQSSANELKSLPLQSANSNCQDQEFNVVDALSTAFNGKNISFDSTNLMTGNESGDTNQSVLTCGNDFEGTIRLSSTMEVLPDPTEVARRFTETNRPQQGARYLLFFFIHSYCDSNGECRSSFDYRVVNVENRVIEAAGSADGACADLAKSFATMISDLETKMGDTFKTEDPVWNTAK